MAHHQKMFENNSIRRKFVHIKKKSSNSVKSSSADKSSLVSSFYINLYKLCPNVSKKLYSNQSKWWLDPRKCHCQSSILIVDSNIYNIAPLKMILHKQFNLVTSRAQNGEEAISKVKSNLLKKCCKFRYNIIFMDINLQGMNGLDTTK